MTTDKSPIPNDKLSSPLRFPPWLRMRSGRDFDRVYALKRKASDRRLLVLAAPNELPHARIGLSISRRHGNSVARHRLRRLMREAFRLQQHALPAGYDYVLIPGAGGREASVEDFQKSLVKLARRVTGEGTP